VSAVWNCPLNESGSGRLSFSSTYQARTPSVSTTYCLHHTAEKIIREVREEIRRHFFSQRVVESWKKIPASLKQAKNVFKNGYRTLRDTIVENT
jgi:hypothetical protein